MPTDHGPELEALRKRLADAKEFLDRRARKELAGLREQAASPNLWDDPGAGPPGHEPAGRRRG